MTEDQAMEAGKAFAEAHLKVIEAVHGSNVAAAYAHGHAWAARDYAYRYKGARAAYTMFAELADGAIVPALPEGR